MITLDVALAAIPAGLREPLIGTYQTILKNYRERRWEPSALNGGKLCEVAYSIIKGHVDGSYSAKPSKPKNMVAACQDFEKADKSRFSRSVRILIPRLLIVLYEIRNNRSIGHTGGDVDPNEMDARF